MAEAVWQQVSDMVAELEAETRGFTSPTTAGSRRSELGMVPGFENSMPIPK